MGRPQSNSGWERHAFSIITNRAAGSDSGFEYGRNSNVEERERSIRLSWLIVCLSSLDIEFFE